MRIDTVAEAIFDGNVEDVDIRLDAYNGYFIVTRREGNQEELKLNIQDVEDFLQDVKKNTSPPIIEVKEEDTNPGLST